MQSNEKALCAFLKGDKKTVRQFTPIVDLPHVTLLAQLDNEVIELIEEAELEAEVEQADEIRERIGLAILTIEDVLVAKKTGG